MVDITDNLCTKQGNLGLTTAVYNQERVIMASVRYLDESKSYRSSILYCCRVVRWKENNMYLALEIAYGKQLQRNINLVKLT